MPRHSLDLLLARVDLHPVSRRSVTRLLAVMGAALGGIPLDEAPARKRKNKKKKKENAVPACAAGEITCPSGSVAACCPSDRVCCTTSRIGCCTPP